ncbi:MAG: ribonuclease HI [Lachnospiraceae bacterium]|nr:ribonuclease HI [Lachnospiraceae bacterium]
MQDIMLFSDGSSRGNPGPGGYGTILRFTDSKGEVHEREYSEGFPDTTNNRMELMGVIRGFEELTRPCRVHVVTDSQYVVKAFTEGWLENWIARDWRGSDRKPVKNIELWQRLVNAMDGHEYTFEWVKGHAGHPENERCDRLAAGAADKVSIQNMV